MEVLNVLVACEESQAVCVEFRKLGHNAFSCDMLPSSGGHPEWHIKGDVLSVLNGSFQAYGQFWTEDETVERVDKWDLMIAHPPCTFLTVTRNKWFKPEFDSRFPTQHQDRAEAITFFMEFVNSTIEHIAIENPIGIMSTVYQKPTQVISPHYFGDKSRKATCLWLKNLPPLVYSREDNLFARKTLVEPDIYVFKNGKGTCDRGYMYALSQGQDRAKLRSKTFPGIAAAMANQWSEYLKDKD